MEGLNLEIAIDVLSFFDNCFSFDEELHYCVLRKLRNFFNLLFRDGCNYKSCRYIKVGVMRVWMFPAWPKVHYVTVAQINRRLTVNYS